MSLIDDLKSAEGAQRGGRACRSCEILAQLPADERSAFDAAVKSGRISKMQGEEILRKNGYHDASHRSLYNHYRNGHGS